MSTRKSPPARDRGDEMPGRRSQLSTVDGPATHVIDAAQNEDVVVVLTQTEATDLDDCEAVIRRGLKTFIEVGTALQKIRDGRLYRTQWPTFEEYLQQRWDMRRETADRTIRSAEVAALVGNPNGLVTVNEAQARELAPLLDQPETLDRVWSETVERTGGKPTAAVIRLVRNEVTPQPAVPPTPRKRRKPDASKMIETSISEIVKAKERLERIEDSQLHRISDDRPGIWGRRIFALTRELSDFMFRLDPALKPKPYTPEEACDFASRVVDAVLADETDMTVIRQWSLAAVDHPELLAALVLLRIKAGIK